MKVYSQLIAAQFENRTSDYAGTVTGAVWLRTDTGRFFIADGTNVRALLVNDQKLILGNNGTAANNVRINRAGNALLEFVLGNDTTAEGTGSANIAQVGFRLANYTVAGLPAAGNIGRLIYNTDNARPEYDTGAAWSAIGGEADKLVQTFHSSISSGITSGEALTANDAVCIRLHNGTGSFVPRFFKCDADVGTRSIFVGFAKASVSVTPNIKTYTLSAAYVTGNVIPITINGRIYSVSYASSSDETLQSLATAIATDADVATAVVTVVGGDQLGNDDRIITITSVGGLSLNITDTTITGGASQPTVTIAQTQAAVGGSVALHQYGPLGGFSGLVVGSKYYADTTAGAITAAPPVTSAYVGYAMSTTVLFVETDVTTKAWPGISVAGYIGGGHSPEQSQITKFTFSDEQANTLSATFDTAKRNGCGVWSATKGYFVAGYNGGALNTIEDINFANDTSTQISTTTFNSAYLAGMSSSSKGYQMAGNNGGNLSSIYALTFSGETNAGLSETISPARSDLCGVFSPSKGYGMGGYTTSYVATIDDLDFGSEISNTLASTLPAGKGASSGNGINSSSAGYVGGGVTGAGTSVNTVHKFSFGPETAAAISAVLASTYAYVGCTYSDSKGYFHGGNDGSATNIIQDLNLSTDAISTISEVMPISKAYYTSVTH